VLLMVLQMWTLRSNRDEEDEDLAAEQAPLPPGPGQAGSAGRPARRRAEKRYLDEEPPEGEQEPPS
jgi:hypothetical protein